MTALLSAGRSRSQPTKPQSRPRRRSERRTFEALEGRQLLATFAVTNLDDTGAGSLRSAIVAANRHRGADTIEFGVAGTIEVGGSALPAITGKTTIDGSTAPGFAGTPAVAVDFGGTRGLTFNGGASGSVLRSLSLVHAGTAGVTLNASFVSLLGNDIGQLPNGLMAGNFGDGVRVNPSSRGDIIGRAVPAPTVAYFNADSVPTQPVSGWQGLRLGTTPGQYVFTGTSNTDGLLYFGPISGVGGTTYKVDVPGAATTSLYGPNLLPNGVIQLVGSTRSGSGTINGFLFQGTLADLSNAADYTAISYPGATYTFVHSTMGGLAVGNADGPEGNAPIGTGHAFLYNIAGGTLSDIVYPGSMTASTTAYGIWFNGGTSFTIVGGYTSPGDGLGHGYMADYDSATGQYSNWTSFDYPNGGAGRTFITHFEGISGDGNGVYTLAADSLQSGSTNAAQGSFVTVRRRADGSFDRGTWVDLNVPGFDPSTAISSANSVAGGAVVGIVIGSANSSPIFASYQAQVTPAFPTGNVIVGNGGAGVLLRSSRGTTLTGNTIGSNARGDVATAG